MREEQEIRKRLTSLENERLTNGPFRERETIAKKATKHALEWALKEKSSC